jgi:hypothetical protein
MPYSSLSGPVGHQQFALFGLPDTTQRVQYGLVGDFVDPYWGGAQAIYGRAGGTIRQGGICVNTPDISGGAIRHVFTEVPNTANLGRSVYVAMTPMTVGQFGWFALSGVLPVNCNAAVAADTTFGIAAAGQGGANTAGKQVLGGRVVIASSTTVAKQGVAANGSNRLQVAGDAGWFIGAYLSGTGIAAGATITDIDPSGTQVTMSAVATAAVNGTVTATYNNGTIFYNVVAINNPIAQGAIT